MSRPTPRLVSVIVPCRNERAHIAAFCDAVLAQRLPAGVELEVLIADGCSDDGTRAWLDAFCNQPHAVRFEVVDNPERIVSSGLNRCIARSRGEVIARLDVHSTYAPDYLAQCLAALAETGADNVGGPWKAEGQGPMQTAIACAFQSRWVAGGARSRQLDYSGWVDTVYLGCWPRATFERHGGFDESLVRNQDDEHNLRLLRAGGRVWQSARIRSTYQPRSRVGDLFRQYRQYGYWKPFVMKKHGQPASLRQLVPALFVAALLAAVGCASLATLLTPHAGWSPRPALAAWPLATLVLAYAAYLGLAVADVARMLRQAQPGHATAVLLRVLVRVPLAVLAYHLGYGLGTWRGWWDVLLRGRADPAFGRLTR